MKWQQAVVNNVVTMAVYAGENGTSDSSRQNWHTCTMEQGKTA